MAVGFPRAKSDIDQRSGQLAVNLRNVFTDIERFGELLALANNQWFLDQGWTQAEVDTLRGAYTDLYKLAQIFKGNQTQATAYNFRTHAQHLMGVV